MAIKNANKPAAKSKSNRINQGLIVALLMTSVASSYAAYVTEGWVPIQDDPTLADPKSLEIEPGSILDFSTIQPNSAITSEDQRLVINSEGKFARQATPTKSLKFLIASPSFDIRTGGFPTKTEIDRHIQQYKMHGYNMVRLHFVEYLLMYKRQTDFDYDPVQLDRFFYFVSQLKNNGMYLILDGLSAPNGGYGDSSLNGYYWDRYLDQKNLKFRVYFDPVAQQHWRDLVRTMYSTVNPYTNTTILQDPVLAGLILVNENNLISVGKDSTTMNQQFSIWLLDKYGSQDALVTAWGTALVGNENLETGVISLPSWSASPSKKMADAQQFFIETEKNTSAWMTTYVEGLGYQGPVTSFNFFNTLTEHHNRGQFEWTDMHNYYAQEYYDYARDSRGEFSIPQGSMLGNNAFYIQALASSKYLGKPFTVSEHGQVAWNQYRREAGLALPAYAAFHGWNGICQHSNSIQLTYAEDPSGFKTIIRPYAVGYDPISRATETLAALLYLRGDVRPANSTIGATLISTEIFDKSYWQENVPLDVSRLSLVTGLGLDLDGTARNAVLSGASSAPYNAQVDVYTPGQLTLFSGAGDIAYNSTITTDNWAARVQNLRNANLISTTNQTDAATGVYESDTGELLFDRYKKQLTVRTLKTEGAVFDSIANPIVVSNLTIKSSDAGALLTVSAMDVNASGAIAPANLVNSKRMLVVLSTNAENTGMQFADQTKTSLINVLAHPEDPANTQITPAWGTQPIQVKPVKVKVALKNNNSFNLKLYSVDLRGKRRDSIAVTKTGCNNKKCAGIEFDLDITNLSHGATTFFEIANN